MRKIILVLLIFSLFVVTDAFSQRWPWISEGGYGDLLIFPYYDVRVLNGKEQDTYFAIINASPDGIAAKLRFREWDKSEEVFDADIWLSAFDVWVGVLTRNPENGLTRITSPDYIITGYDASTFTVSKPLNGIWFDFFTTYVPGGALNEKSPPAGFTAADLTNMGYFEVIGEEATAPKPDATTSKVNRYSPYRNCPNVLSGYAYIVRVADGMSVGYNAVAIADFNLSAPSLFSGPGDVLPSLASGAEPDLEALEYALSKLAVWHGFSIEDSIEAKFSMIVTFPTKHFHFDVRPEYTLLPDDAGTPFTGTDANYGEVIRIGIYNRDEKPFKPEEGWWSPRIRPVIVLPWEVNVVGLYKSTGPVLPAVGERNNVGFTTGGFETGWVFIDLWALNHVEDGTDGTLYLGLPAVALVLQEFNNYAASGPGVAGYYGDIFPAFYLEGWYD